MMRKKSLVDMHIFHLVVLGFVNAFGYILPTLFLLRTEVISAFEYLFQSLYIDLVFTVLLSLIFNKREELKTGKILLPIALAIFGLGLHNTGVVKKALYANSQIEVLTINFSTAVPSTLQVPAYTSKYLYIFLIARLSKCFVCVASKAFTFKEMAYRKGLMVAKAATLKRLELTERTGQPAGSAFFQISKKSQVFKRALFQEGYERTLREEQAAAMGNPRV